jgi:NAD(P)H-flavin reductase
VAAVDDSHPIVTELWIRAPLAARNFRPGQFFRMQTFERHSPVVAGTRLQIPLQTISGAGVDGDRIRLMLLRWGANARIASRLKPGDPLILMGPTGQAVEEHSGRTYLVVAGSWGAAVMLHLGPFLRAAGNRVLYLAAYGHRDEVYHQDELENCADRIIWSVARGPSIEPGRRGDLSVVNGSVIDLLARYADGLAKGRPDPDRIPLSEIDEVLVMGSTGLLKALQQAFRPDGSLAGLFRPDVHVTGTVGSPMQCMLKGVCAQCLQWQIDPESGERTRAVFSCSMQDQPLMWIDVDNLAARQGQTRLMEHLTNLWVDHVLAIEAASGSERPAQKMASVAGERRPAHGG